MKTPHEVFNERGFVWFRGALSDAELSTIEAQCEFGARPGYRPDANQKLVSMISIGSTLGDLSQKLISGAMPVRLVAFNKSEDSNWSVPWHQDRVIAVETKHKLKSFRNWTKQGSYWHAEPPECLLREMMFARVHFDRADEGNGAMELSVGSHRLGKVAAHLAKEAAERRPIEVCHASRGDVLFVKALTLHRSGKAREASRRRALRIDYAASSLPPPLKWAITT